MVERRTVTVGIRLASRPAPPVTACDSVAGCAQSALVSLSCLLVWVGLTSVLLYAPLTNVRAARELLRRERSRVNAERKAFDRFARLVGDMTPATASRVPAGGPPGVLTRESDGAAGDGLGAVESAYEKTVMAMDHYDEDYDEPFVENIATEFGTDVGTAMVAAGELSPELQSALVSNAERSRTEREQYIGTLDDEAGRLADASTRLSRVERDYRELEAPRLRLEPFESLVDRWEELRAQRRALSSLLTDQQRRLHAIGRDTGGRDAIDFYDYLYDDLDVTHPVIVDGLRGLRANRRLESDLVRAFASKA